MHASPRHARKDEYPGPDAGDGTDAVIQAIARRPWPVQMLEMLEMTPDFVAIMDGDGWLHYLNAAGRRLLGLAQDEEICGLRLEDCHPPKGGRPPPASPGQKRRNLGARPGKPPPRQKIPPACSTRPCPPRTAMGCGMANPPLKPPTAAPSTFPRSCSPTASPTAR